MSWQEIIKKRRDIESMDQKNVIHLKASVEVYQLAIGTALYQLVPIERHVVGLRYLRDWTIACIASEMGMSWDGAHEVLNRGTENVLQFLKGSEFEYQPPSPEPHQPQAGSGLETQNVSNNLISEVSP
jgi:DNA-directed RNA polymerase specialized sigma24 family protein